MIRAIRNLWRRTPWVRRFHASKLQEKERWLAVNYLIDMAYDQYKKDGNHEAYLEACDIGQPPRRRF